jgi:hypothetical protein
MSSVTASSTALFLSDDVAGAGAGVDIDCSDGARAQETRRTRCLAQAERLGQAHAGYGLDHWQRGRHFEN